MTLNKLWLWLWLGEGTGAIAFYCAEVVVLEEANVWCLGA